MSKKYDELSAALDQLNIGELPQSTDEDLTELLEVAALLRKSDLPVRPPEHILSGIIARVAAAGEFAENAEPLEALDSASNLPVSKKHRRSAWIYSGVLGAAAALLVFVGIHGFPEIQEVADQVSSTAVLTTKPESTPATSVDPITQPTPASPAAMSSASTSPPLAAPAATKTPAALSAQAVPAVPVSPAPSPGVSAAPIAPVAPSPSPATPSTPAPTPYMAEKSARKAPTSGPSLKSVPYSSPTDEKSAPAPLVALRLPNRQPDSVLRDPSAGFIRQVFGQGTVEELILTQRSLATAEKDAAPQKKPQATPEPTKTDTAGSIPLNKIRVIIHGQQVTLEGRQPIEELTKLAKMLTP